MKVIFLKDVRGSDTPLMIMCDPDVVIDVIL